MIELSRTQDEEVGDGTTSVIILAAELLKISEPFVLKNMHPRVLCAAFMQALDDALEVLDKQAIILDTDNKEQVRSSTLSSPPPLSPRFSVVCMARSFCYDNFASCGDEASPLPLLLLDAAAAYRGRLRSSGDDKQRR